MGTESEGYQRVASLEDVPEGGCLAVEVEGRPVVLIRTGGEVRALENRCPHAGAPLSEGFVHEGRIVCSWHGWSFEVETGQSTDMDDLAVPAHEVRVEGGEVLIRLAPA